MLTLVTNKILVDTNVFIYAIDKSSRFNAWASKLILDNQYIHYTTSKNILEFIAVVTKGENPILNTNQAIQVINYIRKRFHIIYPDAYSMDTFIKLCESYNPKGLLVHDFEIAAISLSHDIKLIATVNHRDFAIIKELSLLHP
jgi:predicted nucleic acid-binding protein